MALQVLLTGGFIDKIPELLSIQSLLLISCLVDDQSVKFVLVELSVARSLEQSISMT